MPLSHALLTLCFAPAPRPSACAQTRAGRARQSQAHNSAASGSPHDYSGLRPMLRAWLSISTVPSAEWCLKPAGTRDHHGRTASGRASQAGCRRQPQAGPHLRREPRPQIGHTQQTWSQDLTSSCFGPNTTKEGANQAQQRGAECLTEQSLSLKYPGGRESPQGEITPATGAEGPGCTELGADPAAGCGHTPVLEPAASRREVGNPRRAERSRST